MVAEGPIVSKCADGEELQAMRRDPPDGSVTLSSEGTLEGTNDANNVEYAKHARVSFRRVGAGNE